MAVRRVVTRSGRGVRGYFPSKKMGRMVAWESLLERDAIYLFEFSTGVVEFHEQPARIRVPGPGGPTTYVPDFELVFLDGEVRHIEIKPSEKLARPDISQRFEGISAHYARIGHSFQILTEAEIRREPLLTNLKLLAYHSGRVTAEVLDELMTSMQILPTQTFGGASAVLGDEANIYRLIAAARYRCDLTQAITPDTQIELSGEDDATLLF